jgi:hypothetical protein
MRVTHGYIGGDGVKVWDLQTYRQMVHLPHDSLRGVASCVKWLTRRDDLYETVCYGTGSGYLSIVRQVPNEVGQDCFAEASH